MSFQAYNPATDTLTPIAENDYKDSLEKISALPTASADLLNKCYLLTANQGTYSKGNIYQCQSDGSSGYAWILINSSGGSAVDVVEDGNMNAVTSNAVYDKFETLGTASEKDFTRFVSPTDSGLPISSSVFSAITNALYGAYHPSGSKTIAELDSSLLIQANVGNVYKITDSGVTTNLFIGGAGQTINVGDNAVVVYDSDGETFKYALQTGVVDLSKYQKKELETPIQVVDSEETTVEDALNALNDKKATVFNGTLDEWEALTAEEQAQYSHIATPDEASTTNVVNRGSINIEYTALAVEVSQTVTFSEAMPKADYVINIEPLGVNTSWRISNKTVNGFTIIGIKNAGSTGVVQYKYTAFMVD